MRSEVKERLMDSKKAAARQISSVRASAVAGTLDADELRERLLLYVLAKFGLAAAEAPSRNLEALAEASLAKALAANRTHVAEEGRSPTCDGVRSAVSYTHLKFACPRNQRQIRCLQGSTQRGCFADAACRSGAAPAPPPAGLVSSSTTSSQLGASYQRDYRRKRSGWNNENVPLIICGGRRYANPPYSGLVRNRPARRTRKPQQAGRRRP